VDLDGPVGPPLGIGWSGPRADGITVIPAGSTLLLFTDGLFERRSGDLDEGRERLRAVVAELAAEPLEQLCDGLLAALLVDGAEDDVALLAVRAHPVDGDRPVTAPPRSVPPERPSLG
jgi:serine phosphatase RsbU (regulator of sigma subunit)